MSKKVVMVVGGGKWQVPIIKKAKALGCIVVNTNLYEASEGFEFADYHYVVDVLDKTKNLEIARKHYVDAVITDQSDIAVNTVGYINEKLQLNGIDIDTADLFTNKNRMRDEIRVPGLHHPAYRLCRDVPDVIAFMQEHEYPVILKPLNNQSSRGVVKVASADAIESSCMETLKHAKDGLFLVEEYIGGIELTVEGFKYLNGPHCTFAVSKKSYFPGICGVADSLLYLNEYNEFDIDQLKAINDCVFENLIFGITHTEYKYWNGKFYLIEAAIRGGGTKVSSHIVPIVSGYDVNSLLIQTSLGENVKFEATDYEKKCAILKFFDFHGGRVKSISGLERYTGNPWVVDMELEFKEGDLLGKPTDDRSRVGYFIAFHESYEELESLVQDIEQNVQVEILAT
jgi:biotin carboxylase